MNRGQLYQHIQQLEQLRKPPLTPFLRLSDVDKAYVVNCLSKHKQQQLLQRLSNKVLCNIALHLDPDDVETLLSHLAKQRHDKVKTLFLKAIKRHAPTGEIWDGGTAAQHMSLNYIQVPDYRKMDEVARELQTHEEHTGKLPTIIVTTQGKVAGHLPIHILGTSHPKETLKLHIKPIISLQYNADEETIVDTFQKHPHKTIVVLGPEDNVIGILYADDIIPLLLRQQTATSLYDFAGVDQEEHVNDSVMQKVQSRYKWLILNLGTAFLATFTVGLFNETIARHVILAMYMPIVAGMGGNAATQTLAIVVRGIALGHIHLRHSLHTLWKELGAGAINGIINGILIAVIVLVTTHNLPLALVLSSAMIINLLVAAFFGTMTPLIIKACGKDPATSASVFITTATDVLGFLSFLGLAAIVL